MKILFLDFDGVLNHTSPDEPIIALQGSAEPFWGASQLDIAAVVRLDGLLEQTGASVVVTSTWRRLHSVDALRGLLASRGLTHPDRIIDVTPQLWRDEAGRRLWRGDEIQAWLDAHPGVTSFVIFDDDDDMVHLSHRLIRTDTATGLLDEHVAKAIAMLG